jgi:hypothetical protein
VVLGGAVMQMIPIDAVRKNLDGILHIFPNIPAVVSSELGDHSGLYGGMAYLLTYDK